METSKKPRRTPIESFGPELMSALLRAGRERFEVKTTYRRAITFRRRVYQLREQMRLDKHIQYPLAARAKVQIVIPEETEVKISARGVRYPKSTDAPVTLILGPHDSEFLADLTAAGVKVESHTLDTAITTASGGSSLEDLMATFGTQPEEKNNSETSKKGVDPDKGGG